MGKLISRYSAPAPMIGYLYQCRYALLESIRKNRTDEFIISIETLDDVVFEPKSSPKEALQLKHNLKTPAKLTNSSTDLWKTLRIWSEGTSSGEIDKDTILFLITTSIAPTDSAPSFLKCEKKRRNILKAIKLLNNVVEKSENKAHKTYYESFDALNEKEKENLLNRVYIMDASPDIEGLDDLIKEELYYAATPHLILFLEYLEGWWFRRVINMIINSRPILSNEIEAEIKRIREEFKRDDLPIDNEIVLATVKQEEYQNKTFVRQLEMIEVNETSIYHAILNYFRAFEHRSKWVRNDLLLIGELDVYETQLIEKWELHFARMKAKVGKARADEAKIEAAQLLYEWIEDLSIPIRPYFNDAFLTTGSYQILSENKRVGWHPDFEELIKKLEGGSK